MSHHYIMSTSTSTNIISPFHTTNIAYEVNTETVFKYCTPTHPSTHHSLSATSHDHVVSCFSMVYDHSSCYNNNNNNNNTGCYLSSHRIKTLYLHDYSNNPDSDHHPNQVRSIAYALRLMLGCHLI